MNVSIVFGQLFVAACGCCLPVACQLASNTTSSSGQLFHFVFALIWFDLFCICTTRWICFTGVTIRDQSWTTSNPTNIYQCSVLCFIFFLLTKSSQIFISSNSSYLGSYLIHHQSSVHRATMSSRLSSFNLLLLLIVLLHLQLLRLAGLFDHICLLPITWTWMRHLNVKTKVI